MQITNAQGERLDLTYESGSPLVVIGHGVTANKERSWAVTLHAALIATGFGALRFSFSGNGASDGDFRESTISKEVADLGAVLDALEVEGITEVVFAGHSMGGAVGVLAASSDRRITRLISLAGMVHTHDFAQSKFGAQIPGESLMWDKPECPLSQEFMDDMAAIGSVAPKAAEINVPWLLVHGTADTVVPHSESVEIVGEASKHGGDATLVTLDGADHLFSGENESRMAAAVVEWLRG